MIHINWQDIQITEYIKIDSIIKKILALNFSF